VPGNATCQYILAPTLTMGNTMENSEAIRVEIGNVRISDGKIFVNLPKWSAGIFFTLRALRPQSIKNK
jgi:hypothetical protein